MNFDQCQLVFSYCTFGEMALHKLLSKLWYAAWRKYFYKNYILDASRWPDKAPEFIHLSNVRDVSLIHPRVITASISYHDSLLDLRHHTSLRSLRFTGKFNDVLLLPATIQYLSFNFFFNRAFTCPDGDVDTIEMRGLYNQPSYFNARQVIMACCFNQPFVAHPRTEKLVLGLHFSSPLSLGAAANLRELHLKGNYPYILTCPPTLEFLLWSGGLGVVFNPSLKRLHWHTPRPCPQMPPNLRELSWFSSSIYPWPLPRRLVNLAWKASHRLVVPPLVRHLELGREYNYLTTFPNGLKTLHLGRRMNQNLVLPDSLLHLHVGVDFSSSILFNARIRTLVWESARIGLYTLPDSLRHLTWNSPCRVVLTRSLTTLKLGFNYRGSLYIPPTIQSVAYAESYFTLEDGWLVSKTRIKHCRDK